MSGVNEIEVNSLLKSLMLKDLRVQCRARGLSPAGARETLVERLKADMLATGNLTVEKEGAEMGARDDAEDEAKASNDRSGTGNNYVRPEGQNVGNFITDRPSSRVLAPPGGGSSMRLG